MASTSATFRQPCPSCGRELELPMEADGQTAACPACQADFTANASPVELNDSVADSAEHSSSHSQAPAEEQASQKVIRRPRAVSIETALAESRLVVASRRRPLFVPFLVPTVLIVLLIIVPVALLSEYAKTQSTGAIVALSLLSPVFVLVSAYAYWFALARAEAICDAGPSVEDQPKAPIRWVPDGVLFARFALTFAVFTVLAAALIGLAVALVRIAIASTALEIQILFGFGAVVVATAIFIGVWSRFWPAFALLLSPQRNVIKSTLAVTSANKMTSFLMIAASLFLLGLGFSIFGLGLPFAIPAVAVMHLVTLRLITGDPIAALEWHSDE